GQYRTARAGADLGAAEDRRAHVPRAGPPDRHRPALRALDAARMGGQVKLRTGLHRRFTDGDGNAYVYVASSAAILGVDPLADDLLTALDGPRPPAPHLLA